MTEVPWARRIDEPIAVVGNRMPFSRWGEWSESMWELLAAGTDAISEGGFIERADWFDASFFGISGRIAERMDPQQRLLPEVSWFTDVEGLGTPARLSCTPPLPWRLWRTPKSTPRTRSTMD